MLKLTALTALTMAFGTVSVVDNVRADDDPGGAASVTTTLNQSAAANQQASASLTVSNATAAKAASNYASNVTAAQQINFPSNYRLNDLRNVNNQSTANEFDKQALPGLSDNNYQSNSAAAAESINIDQLTDQQVDEVNQYALNLVNNARSAFGESAYSQDTGTIAAVRTKALQYQTKRESLLTGQWHDSSILQGDSENISAMQIYADNRWGSLVKPFATAKGSNFINENSIPLFSVTTMDDLRAMVFYGVTTMLFDDASDLYGHAQNFLTNYQPIPTMAIYPSVLDGYGTGVYPNGTHVQYRLKNVDMHFIWSKGDTNSVAAKQLKGAIKTGASTAAGWRTINGKLYRFEGNKFLTGWHSISSCWYYFNADGAAQTGWYRSGAGNWYYFNPTTAQAATNWQKINGRWYYFDDNNAWALKGWFQTAANNWYYFDPTNAWADTGWFRSGAGNWYYFDPQNAWALRGWQKLNNRWYYFDNNNAWAVKGWLKTGAGNWYYFDPANAWARTGWQYINGHWYYFDPQNAWAIKGWFKTTNGSWYYFDPTNNWALTGWQYLNGQWYYFDANGKMATGNVWINGRSYRFDNNGHWLG
ncbi:SEC10/PgrA surface exclusion domain-containing protein [Limosilactobacillus kribbianus]|uniref:SEC10/PgrA surface exclusion domain-containing protein n=1 Tax=Limosilactobacillus kribbianus TaxID=2982695 RepID=UPI002264BFCB|nr:SEC10/PgrA surface exclusion domain-containing protein [Limosilactobacillus kribbianus]